jgi:hypothetical protein
MVKWKIIIIIIINKFEKILFPLKRFEGIKNYENLGEVSLILLLYSLILVNLK